MLHLLETYHNNHQSRLIVPMIPQVWPRSQNAPEPFPGNNDLHHEHLQGRGVGHCP